MPTAILSTPTLDPNAVVTVDGSADGGRTVRYGNLRVEAQRITSPSNPVEVWGVALRDTGDNRVRVAFHWTPGQEVVCVLNDYGARSAESIPPKVRAAAALAIHGAATLQR